MLRICVAVPLHVEFHAGGCFSAPWRPPLCLETLRVRVAFERSGRPPKVSCSLNGTRVKIVNCHMVSGGNAKLSFEGKDCVLKLTPEIKDAAITELARRYGGGASQPITIIAGDFNLKNREERVLHKKLGWGLGICARPQTPARLKLRFAS